MASLLVPASPTKGSQSDTVKVMNFVEFVYSKILNVLAFQISFQEMKYDALFIYKYLYKICFIFDLEKLYIKIVSILNSN